MTDSAATKCEGGFPVTLLIEVLDDEVEVVGDEVESEGNLENLGSAEVDSEDLEDVEFTLYSPDHYSSILQSRMQDTHRKLPHIVKEIADQRFGKTDWEAKKKIRNAIQRAVFALVQPHIYTLRDIVWALDGELAIVWKDSDGEITEVRPIK